MQLPPPSTSVPDAVDCSQRRPTPHHLSHPAEAGGVSAQALQQLLGRLQHQAAQQLQQEVGVHLSPAQAAALARQGAAGLLVQLEEEAEAALPEVLWPHPKVCVNRVRGGERSSIMHHAGAGE